MIDLSKLVQEKITALGRAGSEQFFGVSQATISQWANGVKPPTLGAAQKVLDETTLPAPTPQLQIEPAPEPVTGPDHLYIGMPLYENIEKLTFITLLRCMKLYGMEKISIIPVVRTLIDEARNTIAQRFLKTNAEWLVMLDSDMILPCGSGQILRKMGLELPEPKASRNAIARIMSHPKDKRIVGALYQNRRPSYKPAVEIAYRSSQEEARMRGFFETDPKKQSKGDGLEETGWIGFGMVRIHRSVFLEMQESAKPGGPLEDIAPPKGREPDAFGYFGRTSQWRGEDVAHGRRCQKIGIPTHVDLGLLCGHNGDRYNLS